MFCALELTWALELDVAKRHQMKGLDRSKRVVILLAQPVTLANSKFAFFFGENERGDRKYLVYFSTAVSHHLNIWFETFVLHKGPL